MYVCMLTQLDMHMYHECMVFRDRWWHRKKIVFSVITTLVHPHLLTNVITGSLSKALVPRVKIIEWDQCNMLHCSCNSSQVHKICTH